MAIGAGLFAEEPEGFDFGGACERGPTTRPVEMSRVARARVIELLEEAADGVPLEHMRALMRPGRRTRAASEDYARLTAGIALLRARRPIVSSTLLSCSAVIRRRSGGSRSRAERNCKIPKNHW